MAYIAHILPSGKEQSCKEHMENTAKYASHTLKSNNLESVGFLCGILHDAGKMTNDFDSYIRSGGKTNSNKRLIHSFAAVSLLLSRYFVGYSSNTEQSLRSLTSEILSIVTGSHHGVFDCINNDYELGLDYRLRLQPDYDNDAISNFFDEIASRELIDNVFDKSANEIKVILNSIKEVSASQEDGMMYISLLIRLLQSALINADRTDTAEFMLQKSLTNPTNEKIWDECIKNLNLYLSSFPNETEIQRTRKVISKYCYQAASKNEGIYRLNVPTGGGKTLSSLRFALNHCSIYKKKRIIYVAPFLSIIEQNSEIIRKAINNDSYIFEHHSNIVNDTDESNYVNNAYLIDSWESPLIITTMVQFLNTLYSDKTSCIRRFCSLNESVIIIDEVQSIPIKLLSLFNCAINFLEVFCNATVILCSATQPCFEELRYPLRKTEAIISDTAFSDMAHIFRRTNIQYAGEKDLNELKDFAYDLLSLNNSVLIVCNKVSEALELYTRLSSGSVSTYVITASMCIDHRRLVLSSVRNCLDSNKKTVCITTQLIESGVDISFDTVIRLKAGLDNVVQAAGRCNRNGEHEIGQVYVVGVKNENLSHLKEIAIAKDAFTEFIYEYQKNTGIYDNDITSEKSVNSFYKCLYRRYSDKCVFDFITKSGRTVFDMLSVNMLAAARSPGSEKYYFHQAFKTAGSEFQVLDNNGISVIVYYGKSNDLIMDLMSEKAEKDIVFRKKILNELKTYTINLQRYQIDILEKREGIIYLFEKSVAILEKEYYDQIFGLSLEKGGRKDCSILIL